MLTETYKIKFWIKDGEFWRQDEVEFKCNSRSAHNRAAKWFKNEYKDKEVRLVSVTYQ